jgi:hypothetical protein
MIKNMRNKNKWKGKKRRIKDRLKDYLMWEQTDEEAE